MSNDTNIPTPRTNSAEYLTYRSDIFDQMRQLERELAQANRKLERELEHSRKRVEAYKSDLAAARKDSERLSATMEDMIDAIGVPDANCSCHLHPPCGDCVEYGHLRELIEHSRKLIAAMEGGER